MSRIVIIETNLEFTAPPILRGPTHLLILHHTGSVQADGTPIDQDLSAVEIDAEHKAQGWIGIGYHYVGRKDGSVERGRPRDAIGAQCEDHNFESIGYHVCGTFMADVHPTDAQVESACNTLADLCDIYRLDPAEAIIGHRDENATDCPGDNLYNLIPEIRTRVAALLASPPAE